MEVKGAELGRAETSPGGSGGLQLVVAESELTEFEANAAAERIRRLEADQDLVMRLSAEGLNGPTWERLTRVLVEYGLAVMTAWIDSGLIYLKLRHHGISVASPAAASLTLTRDDVRELASDTVADAILSFRTILKGGGWNAGRGATLATFFVGNCLLRFPNILRGWRRERWDGLTVPIEAAVVSLPGVVSAETVAIAELRFEETKSRILTTPKSPADREVLRRLADGYSIPEICELTGLDKRQVYNRIFRVRKLLRDRVWSQ